jgi:hypothetical protein
MLMRSGQSGKSALFFESIRVLSNQTVSSVHNNMRGITTPRGPLE